MRIYYGSDFKLNCCHDINEKWLYNRETLKWWILIIQRLCKAFQHQVDVFLHFIQCWINASHRLRQLLSCQFQTYHQAHNLHWMTRHLQLRLISRLSLATWGRVSKAISVFIVVNFTRGNTDLKFTSEHTQVRSVIKTSLIFTSPQILGLKSKIYKTDFISSHQQVLSL